MMKAGLKTWDNNGKLLLNTTTQSMKIIGHIIISQADTMGQIKFDIPPNHNLVYFCMPEKFIGFIGYMEIMISEISGGLKYQTKTKRKFNGEPLYSGGVIPIKLFYGYV